MEGIRTAISQGAELTRRLLIFSRKKPTKVTSIILNRAVESTAKMEEVIMNLAVNARDAMPNGGKLIIITENVFLDEQYCATHAQARPGRFIRLWVQDTGVGMDQETQEHVFDPFFTTKRMVTRTGLGLPIVRGVVEQHSGWIEVQSEPDQGSIFSVYLPTVLGKVKPEVEETISSKELQGKGERILVVEDEEGVRTYINTVLSSNGYFVTMAKDTKEALDIFEKEKGDFHLIFSDIVLPDGSGLQLTEDLLSRKPELSVLLSSGYADFISQRPLIENKGFPFLQKPYSLTDLLRSVKRTIK